MNQPALYEALLIARVLLVSLATLTVSLVCLGAFRRKKILVGRRPTAFYEDQRRVPRKGARANHL